MSEFVELNNKRPIMAPHKVDPRVIRTNRLLIDSFSELLKQNMSIRKISIQDITNKAGVNRVTFYAHFADKYQLLSAWKRDVFRKTLNKQFSETKTLDNVSFEQLVDAVLELLFSYRPQFMRINVEYSSILQTALQQEITDIITVILMRDENKDGSIPLQTRAVFLSNAILGTANDWCINHSVSTKPAISKQILALINESNRVKSSEFEFK